MQSQLAKQGLARLAIRWPALRERLAAFHDPTGEFEFMCATYEEACDALDRWRLSAAPNAELRVTEYQQLVNDLELDLMRLATNKL